MRSILKTSGSYSLIILTNAIKISTAFQSIGYLYVSKPAKKLQIPTPIAI